MYPPPMTKRDQRRALVLLETTRDELFDARQHLNQARVHCHPIWLAMRHYLAVLETMTHDLDDLVRQVDQLPTRDDALREIEAPGVVAPGAGEGE